MMQRISSCTEKRLQVTSEKEQTLDLEPVEYFSTAPFRATLEALELVISSDIAQ
jgi:hypothetical protein